MNKRITSLQNARIKRVVSLHKPGVRKKENLTVVEGYREIQMAVTGGHEIDSLFICPDIAGDETYTALDIHKKSFPVNEVNRSVYSKIAYRENFDGIIAIIAPSRRKLDDLKLGANPLMLMVESCEKPGNIGAMMRTADAAGVDAVIVCDPRTDIYNPNVIRASLGSVFTNTVVACKSEEALMWLKEKGIKIIVTALTASVPYPEPDYKVPVALAVGSEDKGISKIWTDNSDENIIIPMLGQVDSMNISVSAAIVLFEALRQRGFRKS